MPEAPESLRIFLVISLFYFMLLSGFIIGFQRNINFYPKFNFTQNEWSQFKKTALPFFAVCFVAFCLYSFGHGGLIDLILSGKNIRAGEKTAGIYQYFFYFSSGLTTSMLLFCGFSKFSKNYKLRCTCSYFFYASFIFALLFAIGTAGRGKIGMVFLLLIIFLLNTEKKFFSAKILLTMAATAIFIFFLVTFGGSAIWVLEAFRGGGSAFWDRFQDRQALHVNLDGDSKIIDYIISFLRNVDHSLASVYSAMHDPKAYQAPRLFFDWLRAFADLFPGISHSEIIVRSTPSGLNRDYFDADGYVPPGWVAMKIINGGLLWLASGTMIAGMIGGWLQRCLMINWNTSPMIPALFIFFAFFWVNSVIGPDPFMVLLPNLSLLILLLLVVPVFKLKSQIQNRIISLPKKSSPENLKKKTFR